MSKPGGIFISGTDTGVGKTVVTAGLALALRRKGVNAVVMKPVETGCPVKRGRLVPSDAMFHLAMLGINEPLELICPVRLRHPLAPITAAGIEGVTINISQIVAAYENLASRYDLVLVEGAGGLTTPIADGCLFSDLAAEFGLAMLLVAGLRLGVINHTLLSLDHARNRCIDTLGIVFNRLLPGRPDAAARTSPDAIARFTKVPALGTFPHLATLSRNALVRASRPIADKLVEVIK
jgi:dethiobiotin synthetase